VHTTSHRPTLVSAWPQSCTSYPNCRLHPPSRANASSTSCGHAHYKPQVNISRCMARLTSSPCEPPELTLWTARRCQKQTNASATHSATCSTTSGAGTLVCTEASPQAAAQWPSPRPPSHVPSEASADGRASPRPPASAPSRPPASHPARHQPSQRPPPSQHPPATQPASQQPTHPASTWNSRQFELGC
jgi:hypothetical protein